MIPSPLNLVLLAEVPVWLQTLLYRPPWILPLAVATLAGMALAYLAFSQVAPKLAAILLVTAKEGAAQPLYYVVMALGAVLIMAFVYVPYNTFGEDVKVLKDTGLTLIMLLGIFVALWTASVSIADEIEGRTALTLLSKPVARWQFILGKFLGILTPVAVLFVLLGALFLGSIAFKLKYDAKELAHQPPTLAETQAEVVQILPGIGLAFMEVMVLTAISVAISTRLPMQANQTICWTIYALGHLVPLVADSAVGRFETVSFVAQFIAVVLPNLDHFSVQAAVAKDTMVSLEYLGWALGYSALYCSFALLAALVLFEDRDLA